MGKLRGQQQQQTPPQNQPPLPPQQSQNQAQAQYKPIFGNIMTPQALEAALKEQGKESPAISRPVNPPSKATPNEHSQSL